MPPFLYPTPDPTDSPSSRDDSRPRKCDRELTPTKVDSYLKRDYSTFRSSERHVTTDGVDAGLGHVSLQPKKKKQKVMVCCGHPCFPASHYHGHQTHSSVISESQAINELAAVWNSVDHSSEEFNIWRLEEFTIYRKANEYRHGSELCPVHHLKTEHGVNELLFNGTLCVNDERRFVQGVPFECLALEGYGAENDTVSACVQSRLGKKAKVWYELGRPAKEYVRYYNASLWNFKFAKYVVDFMEHSVQPVTLSLFRKSFYSFVGQNYHTSTTEDWLSQHKSHDYGQALCANIGFVFKECFSVNQTLLQQPVFGEADPQRLQAIPKEDTDFDHTIVTPFVFDIFKHMPFRAQMQVLSEVNLTILQKQQSRRTQLGLTPLNCRPTSIPQIPQNARALRLRKGDVVSVSADLESNWKGSKSTVWFAFIQRVRVLKNGGQKLDVLWLYQPSDTTLGHGYYPYKNELFLSDNCACGKEAIDPEIVQSVVPVRWFVTDPEEHRESFFVRQKFRTEPTLGAYDFVQLKHLDFKCGCRETVSEMEKVRQKYTVGDTVLTYHGFSGIEILEPAIIRSFTSHKITLQKLFRCCLNDENAPPNQVTPIDDIYEVDPNYIIRPCRVATYASLDDVQSPYDRKGAGDLLFVISTAAPTWNFTPLEAPSQSKLQGMGIFCGGGSFDRGIEEGGGVSFKWAVDWAEHALHTYRANTELNKIEFFLGSVNDYLAKAIRGSVDSKIATVGDVDLLAAGSPCPGFSALQPDRNSVQSLRNCSLVASVCSFVDFYMPTYLVLENVIGMARNPDNAKELNVFSQVLCCLVSMGYQVKQLLMDPGHYGSCQSRQRIFIIATAPGHEPPAAPHQTHSCKELERKRAIGRASNGLPFGERKQDVCPFVSLTPKEAFDGLPRISEGHVQTCVEVPDHRLCRFEDSRTRALIQMIPRWPRGSGFMQAVAAGRMSKKAIAEYPWQNASRGAQTSKSWSRIYPDRLVGCLTTMIKPHDAFGGRVLHYDEPRLMTVMEARRTQGVPDDEVVIGIPTQQWKILGNAVDRKVSFAIGLQVGEAHRKNLLRKTDVNTNMTMTTQSSEERQVQETVEFEQVNIQEETVSFSPSSSAIAVDLQINSSSTIRCGSGAVVDACTGKSVSYGIVDQRSVVQETTEVWNNETSKKEAIEYIIID